MTFEKMQEEYEKDIQWEFNKMDKYLQQLPSIISKYQNHWFKLKRAYDKIEREHDDNWAVRFSYYKHDYDIKLTNSEIKDFLNKDIELNKYKHQAKQLFTQIEWIERCLKNLDSIRWDLKNALDYQKFIAGIL
jgi:hypothetical protein